ncbi:hypothetical protein Scep_022717 [Stephania cephalantha]|uniref:Uncharacterized protein n=1 Tax=Stephania cephalantha TaxID=152367 RepID=A0AAP0FB86_9MAGN
MVCTLFLMMAHEMEMKYHLNSTEVLQEGKERRRRWAQRKTSRASKDDDGKEVTKTELELHEETLDKRGMLPDEIVNALVAREKYASSSSMSVNVWQVFESDLEEENAKPKPAPRKKKPKSSGPETVILNELPPPECLNSSLDFLKKRKMQVPRSSAVLNHSNQALRLISTSGLLNKK